MSEHAWVTGYGIAGEHCPKCGSYRAPDGTITPGLLAPCEQSTPPIARRIEIDGIIIEGPPS